MNQYQAVVMFALATATLAGYAQTRLPREVTRFVESRDLCDHFRGEEPYDAERRAFLKQRMNELCNGTDRRLAALKRKYRADSSVQKKLKEYEVEIESQ
jgi:hypothetical protein